MTAKIRGRLEALISLVKVQTTKPGVDPHETWYVGIYRPVWGM